jgi:hypothetical protein
MAGSLEGRKSIVLGKYYENFSRFISRLGIPLVGSLPESPVGLPVGDEALVPTRANRLASTLAEGPSPP